MRIYSRLLAYGVSIGSTAMALLLSLWLKSLLSQPISAFFYIAIIVSTWYGGFRPGIVTVVLSTLAIDYFLIPPRYQLWMNQLGPDVLRLGLFLMVALTINLIFYDAVGKPVRMTGTTMAIDERKQAQILLKQQFEQQRLVMEMTQRIRRSLDLHDILQTTVDEVRQFLECDRVIIFQFAPDGSGTVVVESVGANWTAILSTNIYDPCFGEQYVEPFKQGLVIAKFDIYTDGIDSCHLQLLANFQVRANLVVPILKRDELWGLLIAHHCTDPRKWQASEIELLQQLAAQVSIAIQQADLFTKVQTELIERQQIEASLRHSEQRYRALVHASAQIVWRSNAEGSTIAAPEGWEELTGQSTAECLGWGWLATVHPDDRDRTAQRWRESYTKRTIYETEYRLRMKDGSYCDFAVRGVPIFAADGTIGEWIGTCTDITARKQAEVAVRENQIQLQRQLAEIETIYQSAPIGLNVLDTDLRFVRINQRLAEINGFSVEAHIGRTVRELLPDLADTAEQLLRPILETGKPILNVEVTGETPAQPGVQRIWLESFLPLKDGESIIGISTVCEEITERKQVEAELKQAKEELEIRVQQRTAELINSNADLQRSESTLRSFFNSGTMLMGIVELHNHDILHISDNQAAAEFLGTTPEAMQNQLASNLGVPQQIIQEWVSYYRQAEQIQAPLQFEYTHDTPNGQSWLLATVCPILASHNEYPRFSYIVKDISDRKRNEAAIRKYERIISTTTDLIVLLNRNYIYQLANQAHLSWCKKSSTEVIGHSVQDILGEELFNSFAKPRIDRCLAGEIIQSEAWFKLPNSEEKFFSISHIPYREKDQSISGVIVSLRDITQIKQVEDAFSHSEERFRQLAENIDAVFWMEDIQTGQVLYVSKAYETIWQSSCDRLYQNSSDWLDAIHPDDRPRVEIAFAQQLITEKYNTEYRLIHPNGSIRWIRDRAFPIKNEAGDMVRIAGIAEDITEQHKIEQMKSEFIGIVSHELRTPLTAIRAALGLLNTGIYDNKPVRFKRMIEIAAIDSDRLVRLVNDILDLERLESGRAFLNKTTCNATDLIQAAVEGVQAIASKEHITLDIHPTDAKVWAAPDSIIQTLTNLLSNAIKFSSPDSTITLSAQPLTDWVLFQVSDQGRGIPTDKLEVIFGRFQQVDASDSRDKGGTGLGLAICRSIIDQHGGQIWAESTFGMGSTFFFTLPLSLKG